MTYSRTKNKKAIQDTFNCVGNYGTEHGIKFNPAKCELITFNNNMKRTNCETNKDLWQEPVTINQIQIPEAKSIRCLSVYFSDDSQPICKL